MIFMIIILIAANLFWLAILIQGIGGMKQIPFLPENAEPASTPKISILVPARNESRILPQTLKSLLQIDYPDFDIFVVDDHSEDNTLEIAVGFAARDPRVRVLKSTELPPHWRGKTWALQQAAAAAEGNWLLLTDADVFHHPRTLRCALALTQNEKLDLLSVVPHMECVSFWEKVVLPSFAAILNLVRPLHKSNDPNTNTVLVSGGFILTKALILRHLGGWDRIRNAIAEDLKIGELYKSSGYRIKTVLSESKWLRTRMYDSFLGIWEGLSRHAFEGSRYSPLRMSLAIIANYLLMVGPFVIAVVALPSHNWKLVSLCSFPILNMIALQTILNYKWKIPLFYFFSFPLASSLYGLMMLNSMLSYYFRGGNLWKGRRYAKEKPQRHGDTEVKEII